MKQRPPYWNNILQDIVMTGVNFQEIFLGDVEDTVRLWNKDYGMAQAIEVSMEALSHLFLKGFLEMDGWVRVDCSDLPRRERIARLLEYLRMHWEDERFSSNADGWFLLTPKGQSYSEGLYSCGFWPKEE